MNRNRAKAGSDKAFDAIIMLVLGIITLAVFYPLVYVISASLSDPLVVLNGTVWLYPVNFSVEGYIRVFKNDDIWMGYRNTIFYTAAGTLISVALTVLGAYPLSRPDFKDRKFFNLLFLFTMFFSGGLIPTFLIIQRMHLVNTVWVMLLTGAGSLGVWNLMITRTFFRNTIPYELQEQAFIDGASDFYILTRIILPLSAPILAVMSLFYGVGHWNSYFNGLIYLRNRALMPLQIFLRELLIQMQISTSVFDGLDPESQSRMAMLAETLKFPLIIVASLPVLVIYPFLQRFFIKGIMVGAVKG